MNQNQTDSGIPSDSIGRENALEETINRAQLENSKQQTTMLRLTIATAFFVL
jgi:hypothetical protein